MHAAGLSHRQAVWVMVLCALMWSMAGIVTRHLESARGFEVTFWRSLFNALALGLFLTLRAGPAQLGRAIRHGGRAVWLSGLCWCVMFTAFMMALTLTQVANVLVTMAIAPLFTALVARVAIGHRLPARTWAAIAVAGAGISWMYGAELTAAEPRHLLGTAVALCVPVAAAVNWTLLQHLSRRQGSQAPDMMPAVLIGAVMSCMLTAPLAWPMGASPHDLRLLAILGVFQLAVPCLLSVLAARKLSAPQASLLALLEVVFGVAWVWMGAGEAPSVAVLGGGALVLGALVANEALALRKPES
jgi:drug/metabolite transporter (DMT)-like permease